MNLDKFFVIDPTKEKPSVSLTILVLSFILLVIAGILNMFEVVKTTSIFSELMYSSMALYFGRKMNVNNKLFNSEKAEKITKKVEVANEEK